MYSVLSQKDPASDFYCNNLVLLLQSQSPEEPMQSNKVDLSGGRRQGDERKDMWSCFCFLVVSPTCLSQGSGTLKIQLSLL